MDIGKYKFIKHLGKGGFGSTSLYEKNGEEYVIKSVDKSDLSRIEIDLLKKIQRKGCQRDILCYIEDFEIKDTLFIVTKAYKNAVDLDKYLLQNFKTITLDKKYLIMNNVVKALMKIHKLGVAHTDIKTSNILINTKTFNIQFIDFGLSCDKDVLNKCEIGGTLPYSSPELLEAILKKTSFKTFDDYIKNDIFCLGMLFYEIMYNTLPMYEHKNLLTEFNDKLLIKLLLKLYKQKHIGRMLKAKQIDKLISQMISFDKMARPTLTEIKKALKKISGCSKDKELNPKTNRCRKRCSPTQIRNQKTNRCIKKIIKT